MEVDLPALTLSAVCVAERDRNLMTADEIAFLLDLSLEDTARSLWELVADGVLKPDGNVFRLRRPLTEDDLTRINRLSDQLEQLRPIAEMLPVRLHS